MLLGLLEGSRRLDEVVFYDTGMEFQAIYHVRDMFLPLLEERGIPFTQLGPDRPFLYDMLERPVSSPQKGEHRGYGWCGGLCRWGTHDKQRIIGKHCGDAHVYVGIAADEPERLARLPPSKSSPLAEWGMTEADCLAFCREKGISWKEGGRDLYGILDRVSCWCCCNKNRKELKNMFLYLPEYWEKLKGLQSKIDRPMKNYRCRKYGEYGNVFEMEKVFTNEAREDERDCSRVRQPFLEDRNGFRGQKGHRDI